MKRIFMFAALATALLAAPAARAADIVDTAVAAGKFKTLAAALTAADLVDALKGKGPFTVLAPTDEAFAKLPEGTVETLLKPENKDQLVAVLTYHVIPAQVPASTVVTLSEGKTLNGEKITIRTDESGVKINNATVVTTDIACDNGLIHVIDRVLLPPAKNNPADSAATGCSGQACSTLAAVVAKGAPMYNAGHHSACASLYRETLTNMMSSDLDDSMKTHISTVIRNADHQHSASERAWTLRRGIDQMYTSLQAQR